MRVVLPKIHGCILSACEGRSTGKPLLAQGIGDNVTSASVILFAEASQTQEKSQRGPDAEHTVRFEPETSQGFLSRKKGSKMLEFKLISEISSATTVEKLLQTV